MYNSDISDKASVRVGSQFRCTSTWSCDIPMINQSQDSKIPKVIKVIEFVADLQGQGPKSRNICSLLPMLLVHSHDADCAS